MSSHILAPGSLGGWVSVTPPPGSPSLWFSARNVDGNNNAGFVDGQSIATWVNLGALGSTWNLAQATAGSRPIFNAIGSAGKMNNQPAAAFNGSKLMATNTGLALQAQPLTWAIVASANGVGSETYFGGAGANAHALIATTLALSVYAGAGPNPSGQSIVANKIHTLTALGNGTSSITSVDGVSGATFNAGAVSVDNLILGANGASANFVTGLIYEVIAYTATTTSPASIAAWVASIYGATPQ